MNFTKLKLSENTLKALKRMGFSEMTPIQEQAIPLLLEGKDLIGQAETGTGKTAAFAIPTIENLNTSSKEIQAIVLCPTRELCCQVADQFQQLTRFDKDFKCVPIYGGQKISIQLKALKQKPQIIIGTPGRVIDHIQRGSLRLRSAQQVILDEADQMLSMGFRNDIETILKTTKSRKQTVLFSATMQSDVLALARKYQKKAKHIKLKKKTTVKTQIEQIYYKVKDNKAKKDVIKRLLFSHQIKSALIFCNTKFQVDKLCKALQADGFSAEKLHGDLKQNRRDAVMRKYRQGEHRILIATDIAARGIDVDDIGAVFNYNLPRDSQDYVHRIGRTGRANKSGIAIALTDGGELKTLQRILKKHKLDAKQESIPELKSLKFSSVAVLENALIESTLNKKSYKTLIKKIKKLKEDSPDEAKLIKTFINECINSKEKIFG